MYNNNKIQFLIFWMSGKLSISYVKEFLMMLLLLLVMIYLACDFVVGEYRQEKAKEVRM